MVAKGAKPGKRVLLVAGVHGDELTPVATVHEVFRKLDPSKLSGSVIGIVGINRPGIEYITRTWPTKNLGTTWINPNRIFPGKEAGNSVERQAWLVMERLVKGNVDVAVDMHTGGFVEYLVELNDAVTVGQKLAIQRNAFGDVVREYAAPAAGRIAIRGTDAIRERGSDIATILTDRHDCPSEGCPYPGYE
jgi:predicted deacylase